MFKSYLKIALRNLLKTRSIAFINITGLAIGIACCVLIALFVFDELSYDRFHEKADRIYRVALELHTPSEGTKYFAVTAAPLAPALLNQAPGIEQAVHLITIQGFMERRETRAYESNILFAGSAFFDVFSFRLLNGNPKTALAQPFSTVLTESMARKYFGGEDPIGETIIFNDSLKFTVTGIMEDVPSNSHFTFDFLIPIETLVRMGTSLNEWWHHDYYTYIVLAESADPNLVAQQVREVSRRYIAQDEDKLGFRQLHFLQPLKDIYLTPNLRGEIGPTGNRVILYVSSVIAGLILLIACINFMNLATARSVNRAREVGMRKVVGAHRGQLARQFLGESMLTTLIAVLLALVLVELALPSFNNVVSKALKLDLMNRPVLLLELIGLIVFVGLLSGSYPALVLSRFRPVQVLKSSIKTGRGGARLRKGLVVFQFAISVMLIVGTTGVDSQLRYMRSQELGFDREQIVVISVRSNAVFRRDFETFKAELGKQPNVEGVSASGSVPGRGLSNIAVLPEGTPENEARTMLTLAVDHDFVETYGLKLAAGRDFTTAYATDANEAFLINEAAVRDLSWESPEEAVGKRFNWGLGKEGRIIGVVKDFHYTSLQQKVQPIVIHVLPQWFRYLSVRVKTDDLPGTLEALEASWQRLVPNRLFEYFFMDQDFDRQYRSEERMGRIVTAFSVLAILIACLGLFGLATFTAEQRTKEIGIRKVLGASVSGIIGLLSKDFVKLVLVANLLAWPIAYFAMNKWLQDFAYRIDIGWWVFALAGGIALVIALLTVSTQAIKAALANPVEALRYE